MKFNLNVYLDLFNLEFIKIIFEKLILFLFNMVSNLIFETEKLYNIILVIFF